LFDFDALNLNINVKIRSSLQLQLLADSETLKKVVMYAAYNIYCLRVNLIIMINYDNEAFRVSRLEFMFGV